MDNNIKTSDLHCMSKGSGFPIFCIHGFSENLSTWDTILNLFERDDQFKNYSLHAFDLVGHGNSPKPSHIEHYSIDSITESTHRLVQSKLKNTQYKQYMLLGYSLGGRIAMHYALKYAHELHGLMLESSSFGIKNLVQRFERKEQDEKLASLIEQNSVEYFEKYWSRLDIFESQLKLTPEIKQEIKNRRLQNDPQSLAYTLRALGQGNLPCVQDDIMHLSIPKLYICGALDKKYVSLAKNLCDKSKMLQVEIVEQAGHNVHLEQSLKFYQLVCNFLTEHNAML